MLVGIDLYRLQGTWYNEAFWVWAERVKGSPAEAEFFRLGVSGKELVRLLRRKGILCYSPPQRMFLWLPTVRERRVRSRPFDPGL
jgi:hypothetical protein